MASDFVGVGRAQMTLLLNPSNSQWLYPNTHGAWAGLRTRSGRAEALHPTPHASRNVTCPPEGRRCASRHLPEPLREVARTRVSSCRAFAATLRPARDAWLSEVKSPARSAGRPDARLPGWATPPAPHPPARADPGRRCGNRPPARRRLPAAASSTTTHSAGNRPSCAAACRNRSGCGSGA